MQEELFQTLVMPSNHTKFSLVVNTVSEPNHEYIDTANDRLHIRSLYKVKMNIKYGETISRNRCSDTYL